MMVAGGSGLQGLAIAPWALQPQTRLRLRVTDLDRDRDHNMVAPVSSPTVLPRSPVFPRLLPLPPHPHPIPPAPSFQRRERFINYRDIWREMDELSDEETAIEAQVRLYLLTTCQCASIPTLSVVFPCVFVEPGSRMIERGDQEQRVQLPHPHRPDMDAARGEERCE